MANLCGRTHGLLDEIFGCDKCKKEEKRQKKRTQAQQVNHANDQTKTFKNWRMPENWSASQRRQFPHGLPPDND